MQSIVYQDGPTTIVNVVPEPGSRMDLGFYGRGQSTCGPDDAYNAEIGEMIATGRALIDLGTLVEQTYEAQVITKARWQELVQEMVNEAVAAEGPETDEESPVNIVVSEPLYEKLKAEHDAAMVEAQVAEAEAAAEPPKYFSTQEVQGVVSTWLSNYFDIKRQLIQDGLPPERAADEAADAATAIALS